MASIYINKSDTDNDPYPIPAVLSDTAGLVVTIYKGATNLYASASLVAVAYLML